LKDEWKKHIRELKVLRAKKKSGGWLPPKEAKRLEWLEERFGDAPEIDRIQVDEPVDKGPKTTTADHGYATEVSEKLLKDADDYKLKKAWEKDTEKKKRGFEARDRREGKATFKQEGLSGFAVEATEDMKEGEIGLAEAPEEEEAQKKIQHGQVVYAQDESERLTKKAEGSNPFALDISDGLSRGLEKHKDYEEDSVPDTAAKSFEVEVGDEELSALDNLERAPTKAEDLSEELQGLLKKSYDLPKDDEVKSEGEASTHAVGDSAEEMSTFDLMQQAVNYTEDQGTVEEEAQVFEIDEEGKTLPYEEQVEDLTAGLADTGTGETVEAEIPDPGADEDLAILIPDAPEEPKKKKPRFTDTAPTRPGVAPSELVTEMGEALPDPEAAEPEGSWRSIPTTSWRWSPKSRWRWSPKSRWRSITARRRRSPRPSSRRPGRTTSTPTIPGELPKKLRRRRSRRQSPSRKNPRHPKSLCRLSAHLRHPGRQRSRHQNRHPNRFRNRLRNPSTTSPSTPCSTTPRSTRARPKK
jgi:hypothetical protein